MCVNSKWPKDATKSRDFINPTCVQYILQFNILIIGRISCWARSLFHLLLATTTAPAAHMCYNVGHDNLFASWIHRYCYCFCSFVSCSLLFCFDDVLVISLRDPLTVLARYHHFDHLGCIAVASLQWPSSFVPSSHLILELISHSSTQSLCNN